MLLVQSKCQSILPNGGEIHTPKPKGLESFHVASGRGSPVPTKATTMGTFRGLKGHQSIAQALAAFSLDLYP
jgi:hypothetical protein